MVSKASELLPLPESPVTTTRTSRGSETVMSFRLCSRAPWTTIWLSAIFVLPFAREFWQVYGPLWGGQRVDPECTRILPPTRRTGPRFLSPRTRPRIYLRRYCFSVERTAHDPQRVLPYAGGGARRPSPGAGRRRPACPRPGRGGAHRRLAREGRGRRHLPGEARRRVPDERA